MRETPLDVDRLLARRQRLFAPPEAVEISAEVVQATRELGQEGIGVALREPPIHVDRFLACRQRFLALPELGEADGEITQRSSEYRSQWHVCVPFGRIRQQRS